MRKLFTDLIEVANERGPGYDVLDPFGLWGENDADVCPDPRRVEIKAILQDAHDGSNTTFYIVPVDRNSSN
jgi:hypothetical protein